MNSAQIEVEHDEPLKGYFYHRRTAAQDKALTMEAKGLHSYLMSLPKGWEIRMDHLQREMEVGRDALRRVVKCLQSAGYMKLETLPMEKGGKFKGKRWRVAGYRKFAQSTDPLVSQSVGSPVGPESRGCSEKIDSREDIVRKDIKTPVPVANAPSGHGDEFSTSSPEDGRFRSLATHAPGTPELLGSPRRPTREQFDELFENFHPWHAMTSDVLWDRLVRSGFRDAKGDPIRNLSAYLESRQAAIHKDTTK